VNKFSVILVHQE